MVRAIWVEDIESPIERTIMVKKELITYGYKLPTEKFFQYLRKHKVDKIIEHLKKKKVSVLNPIAPNLSASIGYGVMRIDEECGFYISLLKLKPEGCPEIRIIIENEQEFKMWFQSYVEMYK